MCALTGVTHGKLGTVPLLLVGPKEAVELGLAPEEAPHDVWLCAWDYSELRFNNPHAKAAKANTHVEATHEDVVAPC
jgi:hypothetical protein